MATACGQVTVRRCEIAAEAHCKGAIGTGTNAASPPRTMRSIRGFAEFLSLALLACSLAVCLIITRLDFGICEGGRRAPNTRHDVCFPMHAIGGCSASGLTGCSPAVGVPQILGV